MDGIRLPRHLAITALAMALAAPLARADDSMHRHTIVPLPYNSGTVIDEFNGNDVRDTRDSTIVRSDVPVDESMTGLPANDTARSPAMTTRSDLVTSRGVGALPDTAVAEAGKGTVTTPENGGPATAERDVGRSGTTTMDSTPGTGAAGAQTDSFEAGRDTAAGVESTRGAGGIGTSGNGAGGAPGGAPGGGAAGAGTGGGAGAGAGGGH